MKKEVRSLIMGSLFACAALLGALWGFKYYQISKGAQTWSRSATHSLKIGDHREAIKTLSGAIGTFSSGVIISVDPNPGADIHLGDTGMGLMATAFSVPIQDLTRNQRGAPEIVFIVPLVDTTIASCLIISVSVLSYLFISRRTLMALERRMQEQQRLREAEVLGRVAQQVAHDIRSPVGALGILRHSLTQLDTDQAELIDSVIGRISGIAQDLLRKAEAMPEKPLEIIDPRLTINRIVEEKLLELGSRASIDWNPPPEMHPVMVRCDSANLERILSNLLNNSAEAMDHPGVIVVSLSMDAGFATISVSDNGRGISKEQLNSLGSAGATFGKAHSADSGHGLGLSHAFAQVAAWDGKLSVSSELGKGTTISIQLAIQSG
jgi:signal transduction histidine kinase